MSTRDGNTSTFYWTRRNCTFSRISRLVVFYSRAITEIEPQVSGDPVIIGLFGARVQATKFKHFELITRSQTYRFRVEEERDAMLWTSKIQVPSLRTHGDTTEDHMS